MNRLKYSEIEPITRQEAEVAFASGSETEICHALIRVVYHDPDWRWLQEKCIQFSKHDDSDVAGLAVTCFGHIARIHRQLDVDKVMRILNELRNNPEIAGRVSDAFDDINLYLAST
jgi:hypothetical protein